MMTLWTVGRGHGGAERRWHRRFTVCSPLRRLNRRESLEERDKLDKDEAHILDLLAQGLLREFLNP